MKSALRYIISLALAGGLIWFVFKDINFAEMLDRFAKSDWRWIALSCFLLLCAHVTRAWRWGMLMEPLGHKPGLFNSSISVLTGYFANYIVPRMGEVTRCGTLYRLERIPVNLSFGTVVAERIFDVLILLIMIGLNFILEFDRLSKFFTDFFQSKVSGGEGGSTGTGILAGILVTGMVVVVAAGIAVYKNVALRDRLQQNALIQKIVTFAKGMLDGFLSIRKLKNPGLFILSTIGIWVFYYFVSYVLFFCIPETSNLGPLAGLTLLVVGAIGMTAPTQGGIGAYHLLVGNVMILYGLSQNDGITLATFIHGAQMIFMLIIGALAFLYVLVQNKKSVSENNQVAIEN
ncbi:MULTISPECIES: lysylphosphatidylglycerol synthase transmembrane domain-containing protein [Dyadobacter]|uniref:Flippase-like domain-containing protein n=1 Tax=Dyadobacter chenhuakuii TaxID=2909339 RepID=A0ABY4XF64_9BACT|nr:MULTISPECIES: lysylphosphatidylglycerol synthase transmembrane domain-containing protein [Dyadobacter]MCF2491767.1 flippase-like domain-containing protein [Dyadobacter chenhuakuii]MCF2516401.1 flippase-like domain-containing protein [Dyadobacter sp. CY351]USJ29069.1 flippase-like domain-containing protein [Dyadobacter chenhuakuii]